MLHPGVGGESRALFAHPKTDLGLDPLLGKERLEGESPRKAKHGVEMVPRGDVYRPDPKSEDLRFATRRKRAGRAASREAAGKSRRNPRISEQA